MCYEKEQEQPWWSSSLHAVLHFHLMPFEVDKCKIEIEVVKSERKPSQTGGAQKEPHLSIIIKGYLS